MTLAMTTASAAHDSHILCVNVVSHIDAGMHSRNRRVLVSREGCR